MSVCCELWAFCIPQRRVYLSKFGLKFNAEFFLGFITNHGYQDLWGMEIQLHIFLNLEVCGGEISTS
jgi:hypothetical protein